MLVLQLLLNIVFLIGGLIKGIWVIIVSFFTRLSILLPLLVSRLLVILLLLAIGIFWFEFHATVLTKVDQAIHCDLKTYYDTEWRQIIESIAVDYDSVVCWTNALSHFARLFTGKFLAQDVASCAIQVGGYEVEGGFFSVIGGILAALKTLAYAFYIFFFTGLGSNTLSIYLTIREFQGILPTINNLFTCICQTIYIVYDIVTRILGVEHIACSLHQYGNALITLLQIFWDYGISFVTQLFNWIFTNGTLSGFITLLFRQSVVLSLPNLTPVAERMLAGSSHLGSGLDDIILVLGCSFASEIDNFNDYLASRAAFKECYSNQIYHIPIFETFTSLYPILIFPSWQPSSISLVGVFTAFMPTISPGYRVLNLFYTFLINIDKVFDYNQFYLRDEWKWEWIIDSLYDPPQRADRISTIWTSFPSASEEYSSYGLFLPNTTQKDEELIRNVANLYGYDNLTLPYCNNSYPSFTPNISFIPCQECQHVANTSFQYKMCRLGAKIDFLIFNQTGTTLLSNGQQRRLFQTLFCCYISRIIRIIGSIVNYPVNFIRNWNNLGTFLRQDQWLHMIFDEIGGRENELGGLLKCFQDLFVYTFDPNLVDIINLFVLPVKSLNELGRSTVLLLPRTVGSILGPAPAPVNFTGTTPIFVDGENAGLDQTLVTYLCAETSSITCFKLETAFQWIRIPRQYNINISLYQTGFNDTVAYRPVLPSNSSLVIVNVTFVDASSNFLNLKFISLFVGYDILGGFNLSFGTKYFFRGTSELIKLVLSAVIIALETLLNYIFQTSIEKSNFILLEWFVCAQNTLTFSFSPGSSPPSNFYCSNIADLTSDLQDFTNAPCIFFLDIEVISGLSSTSSGAIALNCLCDLTSTIAKLFLSILYALIAFIFGILKIASCLIKNSPPPFTDTDCDDDLSDRFIESFEYLDQSFTEIENLFGAIGCLLGNIFGITSGSLCIGGLQPCFPPQPAQCTTSYFLSLAMKDLGGIIVKILQIPIDLVINLLRTTLLGNTLTGFPTSFVQFFNDIVLNIATGLWGDQTASPTPTEGFLQNFGYFLTCTFGPTNCQLTSPNSCIGNLLVQIGNNLRQYFTLLYCTVFNALFFIETLIFNTQSTYCLNNSLSAGGQCAQGHLELAVKCFFEFIFTALFGGNSGTSILDFVFIILKAIVGLIPGIGDGLVVILDIIQKIADFILNVIGNAILGIICVITFGQVCPAKKRSSSDILFTWSNSEINKTHLNNLWEQYYESTYSYYQLLHKYLYGKEGISHPSSKPHGTTTTSSSSSSSPGDTLTLLQTLEKRFVSKEHQIVSLTQNSGDLPILYNQTEFNVVNNIQILLASMDPTSLCFRSINNTMFKVQARLVEYNNTGQIPQEDIIAQSGLSISEELVFRGCYTLAVVPYIYNAASRGRTVQDQVNSATNIDSFFSTDPVKKKRQSQPTDPGMEYAWGTLPSDAFYNPLTGLALVRNLIGAFGYYVKWKKTVRTLSSFSLAPQSSTLDLDPINDISTPFDLVDLEQQNLTLNTAFLSSSEYIATNIPVITDINLQQKRKRSFQQEQASDGLNAYISSRIITGVTFDEYLTNKGIDCQFTKSIFKGFDNFMAREASLNLLSIKSSSLLMTLQYEFSRQSTDPTLLSDPQFGGPGAPISYAQMLLNSGGNNNSDSINSVPPKKKRSLLSSPFLTKKIEIIKKSLQIGMRTYKQLFSGESSSNNITGRVFLRKEAKGLLKHIFEEGVSTLLIPTRGSKKKFEFLNLNQNQDESIKYLVELTKLQKIYKNLLMKKGKMKEEYHSSINKILHHTKHLPIFTIHQSETSRRKETVIRVPLFQFLYSVYNITYNHLLMNYHTLHSNINSATISYNGSKNPWSKFTRTYIMEKLLSLDVSNTGSESSLERMYYQIQHLSNKWLGYHILSNTELEKMIIEVQLNRSSSSMKRQSGFGFNTSCFILDDFITTVCIRKDIFNRKILCNRKIQYNRIFILYSTLLYNRIFLWFRDFLLYSIFLLNVTFLWNITFLLNITLLLNITFLLNIILLLNITFLLNIINNFYSRLWRSLATVVIDTLSLLQD
jgi:hypothetical protein